MRVIEELRHGNYQVTQTTEVSDTLEGFLEAIHASPYLYRRATAENKYVLEAWQEFQTTGTAGYGWSIFTREV